MLTKFTLAALAGVTLADSFIGWSLEQAQINHSLCKASYCGHAEYDTPEWQTHLPEGFVSTKTIFARDTDVEGFVGYLPSDEAIYVVFRGSDSYRNYTEDLAMLLVAYEDFAPECADCKVSWGSIMPLKIVRDEIMQEVKDLMQQYPSYALKITGHSLGANWAQLMSMYLLSNHIQVDHMINFGQMRVGNEAYAAFSDQVFANQFRVVHHQDCIPHSPPRAFGYHH
jgi:hypothetical protein